MIEFKIVKILDISKLDTADVVKVYSGKASCCCGCSGNYRYNSEHVALGSDRRGYKVDEVEMNDAQVRRVLKIIQENPSGAEISIEGPNERVGHVCVTINDRWYIAYLT